MPSISQILAASYPAVIAKRPANQWAESAVLRSLEKLGAIKRTNMGETIEVPLDYQANPGTQELATDMAPTSTSKTEVLTAASYAVGSISVPIVWSKEDEAKNEEQKVELVGSLIDNALESHDDQVETLLFTTGNRVIGLDTLVTEDGTGTIGGIVAGTDIFWKNKFKDYTDASALLADLTSVFNACSKGSGSPQMPKLIVTSADSHAVYEGKLQANQRYIDAKDAQGGFISLAFKTANMVFSQRYTSDSYFFLNPKNFQVRVSKKMWRYKDREAKLPNAEAYGTSLFSVLQVVTDNRSRLGVAFT
nr:MetaGeneMark_Unknown Function [uncultured bacterium]